MQARKVTIEELKTLLVDGHTLAEWAGGKTTSTIQKAATRMAENPKQKKGVYFFWEFTRQFFAEKDLGNGITDSDLDPARERARVDKERADQLEIKNANSRAELRDAEAFYMVNAQVAQRTIAMLNAMPNRIATNLAAQFGIEPELIRNALQKEIDAARSEIIESGFSKYEAGIDDLDEPLGDSH
jgi:phage terminase Nu1 subunit (DNA packaging protein)